MLINNKSKRHHEAGFSLIEVMIAAVLVVVIAVMVSSFMSKGQKQAAQQATQDQSIKIRQSLADLLKRDLAYVVNPADVVIISLHEMTIKRPKLQPGNNRPDLTQTYQVRYRGVCTPIPATLQTPLSSFNFATLPVALQKRSSCTTTATLKCGAGTYPQVRIEPDAGANIPTYPGTPLPNLTMQSKAFHGSIGLLPCFQRTGNQIAVGLDAFMAKNLTSPSLDLMGERFFLVIGNVTDMIILQK